MIEFGPTFIIFADGGEGFTGTVSEIGKAGTVGSLIKQWLFSGIMEQEPIIV